ncbi:MAG TPA: class I adenylate-forming enzyme family protein, partial [Acidimicrobiia bacterium]|nr:class I adenylate-forming enzyme family protein [Acidimicrobiia bacterium]
MNTPMLIEMAADGMADRVAVGSRKDGLTYAGLLDRARRVATVVTGAGADRLVFVAQNSALLPALLFGSGVAGVPFVPVNYRLADEQLCAILARTAPALAVVDESAVARIAGVDGLRTMTPAEMEAAVEAAAPAEAGFVDPDEIAVLLYTSGTTGEPKAAVLRHKHLASYVISTVEFMGAADDHAALVSVPPYHVAGMATILTSLYGGRRLCYLPQFEPTRGVETARDE